jgi:hypothetical protein
MLLTPPGDWRHSGKGGGLRRASILGLLICLALVSELRFDWLEQSLGYYLATTNSRRPEWGAIWEKGRSARQARQEIDKLVADRMTSRREAEDARSFTAIAQILGARESVILPAHRFLELYRGLPLDLAAELLSPYALIHLLSTDRWDRTYFERTDGGLRIYLLTADNRVLQELSLGEEALARLERGETAARGRTPLEALAHRIYPGDQFFAALSRLPEDVQRSVIAWPERLLGVSGRISRVGVADEVTDGYVAIGVEIQDRGQEQVMVIQGRDWAVWRLTTELPPPAAGGTIPNAPGGADAAGN